MEEDRKSSIDHNDQESIDQGGNDQALTDRTDTPYRPESSKRLASVKVNKVSPMKQPSEVLLEKSHRPSQANAINEKIKSLETTEDLTLCGICKSAYDDPHSLPCFHVFCKSCLQNSVNVGKIECWMCNKVHSVPNGNLERVIRPSNMTNFIVRFKKDKFDQIEITESEKKEHDGIW